MKFLKRLKLKKKKLVETLESLKGFYDIVHQIYNDGFKFENNIVGALVIRQHIFYILDHHFRTAQEAEITTINKTKFYEDYVDTWNKFIVEKEPELRQLVDNYLNKDKKIRVDYIV